MNGGCWHLSTGGVHQTTAWFMLAISHQRWITFHEGKWWDKRSCFLRVVCEQDSCERSSVHWQQLLSGAHPLNLCEATHNQPCWPAWCYGSDIQGSCWRRTLLQWKASESWKESHSDFYLLLSHRGKKKSIWIYFIWQCKDRSQRRNPNAENSLEP